MRSSSVAVLLVLGIIAGCDQPAPKTPPPAKSDIEIKAPGVDIKIDKDKPGGADVDVKASGTDVKVDGNDVKVDAPGAKVDVDK